MPWKSDGGSPWGSGGGGGQGPWGGRGPSGPQPPNIEELLRRSQERLKRFLPGGFKTSRGIVLILIGVAAIWLASGFYIVQPGNQGVELLFGRFVKLTSPGLNYWFPGPVGQVITPNVDRINQITIGYRVGSDIGRGGALRDVPQESLMLTGDQNVIDMDFIVQWKIKDASSFLFNIREPELTIKVAAESAMREVIGNMPLDDAMTTKRAELQTKCLQLLQQILDEYQAGVLISDIKLQKADPPNEVIDAFNDVQRARQDKERLQNEAMTYANDIVPRARGQAQRVVQEAAAYREKLQREAEGEANRFLSVYEAYLTDKEVTRRRLYLERMQELLRKTDKVILDIETGQGQGVVPYLPLPELKKRGAH